MGVKTIYLPDEICFKLKTEKNASQLISRLLFDHYKSNLINEKDLLNTREKIEKEKEEYLKSKELELKKIDDIMRTQEDKKVREEEEIKLSAEKERKLFETIKDNVALFCDVDNSEINQIAEMYLIERESYKSFFDWCEAKGIILKEVKENVK